MSHIVECHEVNEFLKNTWKPHISFGFLYVHRRPRIMFNDGYSVSIQADDACYCDPRINVKNYECPVYREVELGFPNKEDDIINEYAESDDYTETVYGYVPVEIVNELIKKHGGVFYYDEEEWLEQIGLRSKS